MLMGRMCCLDSDILKEAGLPVQCQVLQPSSTFSARLHLHLCIFLKYATMESFQRIEIACCMGCGLASGNAPCCDSCPSFAPESHPMTAVLFVAIHYGVLSKTKLAIWV